MSILRIVFTVSVICLFNSLGYGKSPVGRVVVWGDLKSVLVPGKDGNTSADWGVVDGAVITDAIQVSAGSGHALVLRADGTVLGAGWNVAGQATGVPTEWDACGPVFISNRRLNKVIAIAAGRTHSLAVKGDGSVVAWGDGVAGDTNVPSGLSNVVSVAAGDHYSYALKGDGTLAGWGYAVVPNGLSNVASIAVGKAPYAALLALKRDGTVVQWTGNSLEAVPEEVTNVAAIAAGSTHYLALRRDSTVVGWGGSQVGEANGFTVANYPYQSHGLVVVAGQILTNVVAISAGNQCSYALKRDGTVVSWGPGPINTKVSIIPPGLSNVVAISCGGFFGMAVVSQ